MIIERRKLSKKSQVVLYTSTRFIPRILGELEKRLVQCLEDGCDIDLSLDRITFKKYFYKQFLSGMIKLKENKQEEIQNCLYNQEQSILKQQDQQEPLEEQNIKQKKKKTKKGNIGNMRFLRSSKYDSAQRSLVKWIIEQGRDNFSISEIQQVFNFYIQKDTSVINSKYQKLTFLRLTQILKRNKMAEINITIKSDSDFFTRKRSFIHSRKLQSDNTFIKNQEEQSMNCQDQLRIVLTPPYSQQLSQLMDDCYKGLDL